jgi:4-amino-4-deoxy-L-arabinose transferase-like glycosyltransferase
MLAPLFLAGRSRKLTLIRVALLGAALVATFVFHLTGTALVELRIAQLVLLVALLAGLGLISRHRRRRLAEGSSDHAES